MKGRLILAFVLLVVGGLWLLDASGRTLFPGGFATWWPSILVLVGALQLFLSGRQWRGPFVLVVIGLVLQAWRLGYLAEDMWRYVAPLALVLLAILLLLPPYPKATPPWTGRVHHERPGRLGPEDAAVFSEQHVRAAEGAEYRGGELTAVFGRLDADLTKAKLPAEGARLKATSVFGGVTLRVPAGWRVEVHGTPVGGQTANRTAHAATGPTLDVEAVAVFGRVDVVNG